MNRYGSPLLCSFSERIITIFFRGNFIFYFLNFKDKGAGAECECLFVSLYHKKLLHTHTHRNSVNSKKVNNMKILTKILICMLRQDQSMVSQADRVELMLQAPDHIFYTPTKQTRLSQFFSLSFPHLPCL